MKDLMIKSVVLSVVFGLVFSSVCPLSARAAEQSVEKKININTASVAVLQELPRIGEKVAQRIVDFRKTHGKFKRIEEIMKVQGIGEKIFQQIKDRITVE